MGIYADLFRYRELFASLFRRDLRAKYKGSFLGLAWSLALPVLLMLVYLLVFSVLWRAEQADIEEFWLFLLCGLPPWAYFSGALQSSARSLIENANLIRKVRFPRQLVPLSIVATQVVAFAAMLVVVVVLSLVFRPQARDTVWLVFPLAVAVVLFVAGVSLAIASLNAVFRDVEFVVSATLLPWFFLTPVLYQLESLPGGEAHPWLIDVLHWANPVTPAILAMRAPLFFGELPALGDTLYLLGAAAVALALGALVFSRVDDRIASEA
jgi:lipopolysaccharide transport system permease protein